MTTETRLVQEHRQIYRSFIRWTVIFGAHIIAILGLLAIFRT